MVLNVVKMVYASSWCVSYQTNALLAEDFLQYFDGFSIGSKRFDPVNPWSWPWLGIVSQSFDERDPAVKNY